MTDIAENTIAIANVDDHVELVAAMLDLRLAREPEAAIERLALAHVRIRDRVAEHPWLCILEQRLGLSETEALVVWLLAAIAGRADVRDSVARIGDSTVLDPTLDTIRRIVYGESPSTRALVELGGRGALRGLAIIEASGNAELHDSRQTWAIARTVLAALHGVTDIELGSAARIASNAGRTHVQVSTEKALSALDSHRGIIVTGPPGSGRRSALVAAARDAGVELVEIRASMLSRDNRIAQVELRRIARDCRLLARVPIVLGLDELSVDVLDLIGTELIDRVDGPVFATGRMAPRLPAWPGDLTVIDLRPPTGSIAAAEIDPVELRLRRARAQVAAALAGSPTTESNAVPTTELPIGWFTDRLGLTNTEDEVLWLLIAHELCPVTRQQLRAMNTEQSVDVSWDTLRRVVYGATATSRTWAELSPNAPLFHWQLVERSDSGQAPIQRQTIRVAPRVLAAVHGDEGLDVEIATFSRFAPTLPDANDLEVEPSVLARLTTALESVDSGLVMLAGASGSGRRTLLVAAAGRAGRSVIEIDADALSKERERSERQLRVIARECRLHARVPLFRHLDRLGASGDVVDRIDLVEDLFDGLVLATTPRPISRRWRSAPTVIEVPRLTNAARAWVWAKALPTASMADAELLANMYPIAPALICEVGRVAQKHCGGDEMKPEHVEIGIRTTLDDRLMGLATRVTTTQSWSDVVLPDEQASAIVELLARIRERSRVYEEWGFGDKLSKGLGVSALFSGPPGTGKTMTAGLIARDLGIQLYQVDLAKIVSKWIGETEKNLATLFDCAEAGHAILLFDEADALFGKRTDVRSSNDRHANQEVNYLLQRLETFSGICILTTNHESAIDEAFRRRFAVQVRFVVPEMDERLRLWQSMLPATAPRYGDLGLAALATKYAMTGGHIRNAALRAAFLAADDGGVIVGRHLALAAQLEYEAMGSVTART